MTDVGYSSSRPVLFGRVGRQQGLAKHGGGGGRVDFRNPEARAQRLAQRFAEAIQDFEAQVTLSNSIQASDPQLVLVFEGIDETVDLANVAKLVGFEVLAEQEGFMDPDQDHVLSARAKDPQIKTCIHAICLDSASRDRILTLWESWQSTRELGWGYSKLRDLFDHLKDVRVWGPEDRLRGINWDEYFANQIPEQKYSIELELWFRGSTFKRRRAQEEVSAFVEGAGGKVTASSMFPEVGYHGLKCEVPAALLQQLARGEYDQVQVVRSANVMYLRVAGQLGSVTEGDRVVSAAPAGELPTGAATACLLDGVPASNHLLLAGRLEVLDPDDLASATEATVELRRHGTAMASAVIWGDRSGTSAPLARPILIRPILAPSPAMLDSSEEVAEDQLMPDLMRRVFRELFEGPSAAAPEVVVVNLSVCDPTMPFDSLLSAWARTIDWLSFYYGVLVIVSAGNHASLAVTRPAEDYATLTGMERRDAVVEAELASQHARRMYAPAESINALSIAALHSDQSPASARGYAFDPSDGNPMVSMVSPFGGGHRRSLKPELAAPGGRVLLAAPVAGDTHLRVASSSANGPGIRVASPGGVGSDNYQVGTSIAAALVTRQAVQLNELLTQISQGVPLTRHQRAVAVKALLAHSASQPDVSHGLSLNLDSRIGFGALSRDLSEGCLPNEAVVLYLGSIGDAEEQELLLPLPNGLNVREAKRITATLAWLSPVNWRHRQYRQASLNFAKPSGSPSLDRPSQVQIDVSERGSNTLKHLVWDTEKAFGTGQGSNISLKVKCFEQGGGFGQDRIDYAVALSLWVSPLIQVDVYDQVRAAVQQRVAIRPEQR